MRRIGAVLALAALVALAGCIGTGSDQSDAELQENEAQDYLEDVEFNTSDKWSHTLDEGSYEIGEPQQTFVTTEEHGDDISIGIVKPADLGPNETVPVVADVGPYYGELEGPVTNPDDARLDNFLIENLVPHGYAVAMVSVPGTGDSGGCEDYFGPREQEAVDQAVNFLAEKDWSNGNVGLIGKSYDGSTPWEAAATPAENEHLKTIVPMAGIPSFHELHFMNGTAESRAAFLNMGYWTFGVAKGGMFAPFYHGPTETVEQPDPAWAERACPAVAQHLANGAYGTATGGQDPTGYWAERSFEKEVQENYDGSIFIVHGLQDWNVHPDVVTSIWDDLDNEKKLWFGQWSHIYPDRPEGVKDCDRCPYPDSVRWDFAETLKRWFDSELKNEDVDTGPKVWSEDNRGGWHASEDWPPQQNTETHQLYLGDGKLSEQPTDEGSAKIFTPPGAPFAEAITDEEPPGPTELTWTSSAFEERTRITGEPKLHVTVTPSTPDGNLHATVYDIGPNGEEEDGEAKRVGHAFMNVRYHEGGTEEQTVTPGEPIEMKMQLFPLDVVIPEDHKLKLKIEQVSPVPRPSGPIEIQWGGEDGSALTYTEVAEYETGLPWEDGSANGTATGS